MCVSQKVKGEIFNILFSYEDEDIGWFSNPTQSSNQTQFKPFSRVSTVEFEQVHICWSNSDYYNFTVKNDEIKNEQLKLTGSTVISNCLTM